MKILDCTLRDGGYVNNWDFGKKNISKIINGLVEANIDIIECGFLTKKTEYNENITKFNTLKEIACLIPENRKGRMYVCMTNYGEININDIPDYDGTSVDGIRVAFHKEDLAEAMKLCKGLVDKGYKVFIQAMVSLNYTDEEMISLIKLSNSISPYAFYIVDSFGVMKKKDLLRLYYLVEHNLNKNILIGYHSHNNLQLAYSNAQVLADMNNSNRLIIDASVFGMGRGAGNLNTELFVEYVNDNRGANYLVNPLLKIIDEVLNNIYLTNYWGYSLSHYLSAVYKCHPNYSSYLSNKNTLTMENIDEILEMVEANKRNNYDIEYIEKLYIEYMNVGTIKNDTLVEFKNIIDGKSVLIIAPGKSVDEEKEKVKSFISSENLITISVNFIYQYINTDYIFISNIRRFNEIGKFNEQKFIVTSNISTEDSYLKIEYSELLNDDERVKDNAGLMLIKFLVNIGVKNIFIAGIDGFSYNTEENYVEKNMEIIAKKNFFDEMNKGIYDMLCEYSQKVNIKFLTKSMFSSKFN